MQLSIMTNYYTQQVVKNRNVKDNTGFCGRPRKGLEQIKKNDAVMRKNLSKITELTGGKTELSVLKDGSYVITANYQNADGHEIWKSFTFNILNKLIKREFCEYENGTLVEYLLAK